MNQIGFWRITIGWEYTQPPDLIIYEFTGVFIERHLQFTALILNMRVAFMICFHPWGEH